MTSQSEDLWGWKTLRTQLTAADFRPWLRIPVLQQTSNSSTKSWSYDAARLDDLRIWKLVILPRSCLIFLAKGSKEEVERLSRKRRRYINLWYTSLCLQSFLSTKEVFSCLESLQLRSNHFTRILYVIKPIEIDRALEVLQYNIEYKFLRKDSRAFLRFFHAGPMLIRFWKYESVEVWA